jgi:hypothetical protein
MNDQILPNERCINKSKERAVTPKEWLLEEREG